MSLGGPRRRRRPSLTPMIDVVFLLLVFFMLAARFGQDTAIPLTTGTGTADWVGPPRLVELSDTGLRVNGVAVAAEALADTLRPLMPDAQAPVILRATGTADLAALIRERPAARAGARAVLGPIAELAARLAPASASN